MLRWITTAVLLAVTGFLAARYQSLYFEIRDEVERAMQQDNQRKQNKIYPVFLLHGRYYPASRKRVMFWTCGVAGSCCTIAILAMFVSIT